MHPFDIPLPSIGGTPAPFVEPFFSIHGDHSHAVTSELFPLLTAPLLALLGLRGLYVLPALGFLIAVAACGQLGVALDPRRNAASIAVVAALATPLLFYGLEFWEHAPAVGFGALGALVFVKGTRADGFGLPDPGFSPATPPGGRSPKPGAMYPLAAGVLFGAAALLRPEAGWFAVAVVASSRLLPAAPSWRALFMTGAGAAVVVAPFELHTLIHFGTLTPPHVGMNAGLLGESWLRERAALASAWFMPGDYASLWRTTPVVAAAVAAPFIGPHHRGRSFLWAVAAADAALVLLTGPNDGGAQWTPRYLLFVWIPLAVLAADAVVLSQTNLALVASALLIASGAWTQRVAYRTLRGTKITYGRVVDVVSVTAPDDFIVTDLWWLDQVAAARIGAGRLIYADGQERARTIMTLLSNARPSAITVVTSRLESLASIGVPPASCFAETRRAEVPIRQLIAVTYRCRVRSP